MPPERCPALYFVPCCLRFAALPCAAGTPVQSCLIFIRGQQSHRQHSLRNRRPARNRAARIPSASAPTATPPKPSKIIPSRSKTSSANRRKCLAIPGIGKGMLINLQELVQRRQPQRASRTAEEISSVDAAVTEDSGPGTKDDCADLERPPGLRRRWSGETCPRRQDPRTAAHGREARAESC